MLPLLFMHIATTWLYANAQSAPSSQISFKGRLQSLGESIKVKGFAIGGDYTQYDPPSEGYVTPDGFFNSVPSDFADKLHGTIGAQPDGYFMAVNCNNVSSFPKFILCLEGKEDVELDGPNYLLRVGGNCLSPFMGIETFPDKKPHWWMGEPWMRRYDTGSIVRPPTTPYSLSSLIPEPQTVELRGVALGTQRLQLQKETITVHPGYIVMHMPSAVAATFNAEIGAEQVADNLVYVLDCGRVPQLPSLVLYLARGGVEVEVDLKSKDYVLHAGGNCFSPFIGLEHWPWLIGEVFVRQYGPF